MGVHPQVQDGLFYVGCAVPAGRLTGLELVEVARLADTYGDGHVRLGVDQNFILSGVPESRIATLLNEATMVKFSPHAGPFSRGVVACTGNEFCRYAITETKQRAVQLAKRLDARLDELRPDSPLRSQPLRIHLSGCSASCAQPQIADIGLRGAVHKSDYKLEEAYDVGLGGALGPEAGFLNWIEGALPARQLEDAIMNAARAYDEQHHDGETFTAWSRRTSPSELRTIVNGRPS